MSFIDKIVAAIIRPESAGQRAAARRNARLLADPGDWLWQILDHHAGIEAAFADVRAAHTATARVAALERLGYLLAAHAQAEELVIYPELAHDGETGHAANGYDDQAMIRLEMAVLERLDPQGQDFADQLARTEEAVAHHLYAEESDWLLELRDMATADEQALLSRRYAEVYRRYVGLRQTA